MSTARARRLPAERGVALAPAVFRQGMAGFLGALLAFTLLEPQRQISERFQGFSVFHDVVLVGLIFGALVTAFLAVAEELRSGNGLRLLFRGVVGAVLGALLGVVGFFTAGFLFSLPGEGVEGLALPVLRPVGWALVGACVGLCPGLLVRSDHRMLMGMAGGAVGGVVGGLGFDFLAMVSGGGTVARCIGYSLLGLAIGGSTAAAEVLNRVAWLTFLTGPQEGRTVLLHRDVNVLGKDELADVPLFGDRTVQRRHALILLEPQPIIELGSPIAALTVDGLPVQDAVLSDGSVIQIGRHRLRFNHRDPETLPQRILPAAAAPAPNPAVSAEGDRMEKSPRGPVQNAAAYVPGTPIALRLGSGSSAGKAVLLTRGITLGRETDNDLTILDPKVSRYHARIEPLEGAWVLSDLGSTNGTRLNGVRIVRAGLVPGDHFYVGDTLVSVEDPRAAAGALPPMAQNNTQAKA